MDLSASPATVTVVRRVSTVAFVGLVLVGGWQIRGAPLVALGALGAVAFLFTVAEDRLSGELDRFTLQHKATRSVRTALVILAAVGAFVLLDDLELIFGAAVIAAWWKVGMLPRWLRNDDSARDGAAGGGPEASTDGATGRPALGPRAVLHGPVGAGAEPARPAGLADLHRQVRELDGPALAQAWADCQPAEAPSDSAEFMRISQLRQVVLDELERRDPQGFAAWLERGAPTDDPPVAGHSRP